MSDFPGHCDAVINAPNRAAHRNLAAELADAQRELRAVRDELSWRIRERDAATATEDQRATEIHLLRTEMEQLRVAEQASLLRGEMLQHSNDQLRLALDQVNDEVRRLREEMRQQEALLRGKDNTISMLVLGK